MVCSGSEANDLALRIARCNAPGATHVAIMGGAYHGHTTACIDLSPYKYDGPGGLGKPDYVHVLPCPDVYRYVYKPACTLKFTEVAGTTYSSVQAILQTCLPACECQGCCAERQSAAEASTWMAGRLPRMPLPLRMLQEARSVPSSASPFSHVVARSA